MIGVDLNPSMCLKAQANAAADGGAMECHEGRMEDIPVPDDTADVIISNGVINLSFRKQSTQNSAEAYGVKAVMMTALKPSE